MGAGSADKILFTGKARARRRWHPGLLDLYLLRSAAGTFAIVLATVVVALMLERALRLIHELAARGADLAYFLPLLGRLLPYYLALAIPLAFLVALVLLVARLDRRQELQAMLASGVSLARTAAPLVMLGLVLSALALWAAGWLEPYGRYGFRALRIEAVNAGRIGALQPRALFQAGDDLIVTFDKRLPDGSVTGVFLWQRLEDGDELALSGGSGRIGFSRQGSLFGVDFSSGRYLLDEAGERPLSVDFADLEFREELRPRYASWERGWDQKELTLPELAHEARTGRKGLPRQAVEAELYATMARAALIPLVPLLVLPLAFATKGNGRMLGVLLAGGLLVLANNGLNLAKNLSQLGSAEPRLVMATAIAVVWLGAGVLFLSARTLPSHSPVHSALGRVAGTFAKLSFRTRARRRGRRIRSLGAHLASELARWSLLSLVMIATFLQMVDLIDRGDDFVERGIGIQGIALYALLRLPQIVQQAAPLAALAGAVVAFASLASARETTAMRAAGISQWRLVAMAAPVPLALLVLSVVLAEGVTPASQVRLANWWSSTEPASPEPVSQARWFRVGSDIVRAGGASPDGRSLHDVHVYRRDRQGRIEQRIIADHATIERGQWLLEDAQAVRLGAGPLSLTRHARLAWDVTLLPEDLAAFFAAAQARSAASALRGLDEAAPVHRGEAEFATRLHRSAAEPLAPLVMLLFALPLAFVPPRTGRSWPTLLYAVGGGLIYLVADGTMTVAAQVGYVTPLVGAWVAPVLGLLIAVEVLFASER